MSFSGGKDSTVLLDLVRRIYPDVPAVFIDTGLEYPEIRNFVKTFDNVEWVKPKMNFKEVIMKYGYPVVSKEVARDVGNEQRNHGINRRTGEMTFSHKFLYGMHKKPDGTPSRYNKDKWRYLIDAPFKVSNQCCEVMKKRPAHAYERASGRKPIIATMTEESTQRRMQWLNHGCNVFDGKKAASRPMSFWTEQDVLTYIVRFGLPYAEPYGEIVQCEDGKYCTTKCDRTGCVFCAFGAHLEKEPNRFQRLKLTHPKLWDYCMKPTDQGGLGMREVLGFIGVKVE